MFHSNILLAFLLTLLAGLSTGIGSFIAFFARKTNTGFLSVSLGFSAGVMIYVSMIEIFPEAEESLSAVFGDNLGAAYTVVAFFAGIFFIGIIDRLVPSFENPHEPHCVEDISKVESEIKNDSVDFDRNKMHRLGLFTALAITIHNFPEGLATFMAVLHDPALGLAIAIAIALHNIPEGIAVSVPIYYATGSRKKAFLYSFLSGLAEPLGAIIGFLILMPFMNDAVFGFVFAMVGGIMVYISLDELLPAAQKFGKHHLSIYGLIAGMIVMAISILMLEA